MHPKSLRLSGMLLISACPGLLFDEAVSVEHRRWLVSEKALGLWGEFSLILTIGGNPPDRPSRSMLRPCALY